MSTNDSDDKTGTDEQTPPQPTALTVQPSVSQVYSRIHLFGIPQELQDQIFDEVFDNLVKHVLGAKSLEPLLTCRHVYHIANKKAWAGAAFSLAHMIDGKLSQLKSEIPPSISHRHAHILIVSREQLLAIHENHTLLPQFKFINVTGPAPIKFYDIPEVRRWHRALIISAALHRTAPITTFPPEIFSEAMALSIGVESALQLRKDLRDGDKSTVTKVRHQKMGEWSEHYSITFIKEGKEIDIFKVFRCAGWLCLPKIQASLRNQVNSP